MFNRRTTASVRTERSPSICRRWAENFSLEKVGLMYQKYFQDVLNVHEGKGWYEEGNGNVDWLRKELPK
jgi:hypothetical protein